MDKFTENGLLFEFYGALLSQRQRQVTALYYDDNLTLAEIGEQFGITRQGAYDALRAADKALHGYEEKLGLVAKFQQNDDEISAIAAALESLSNQVETGALKGKSLVTTLQELSQRVTALAEE